MNTKNLEKVLFKKTKKSRLWGGIAIMILGLGLLALGGRIFIGYMTASKELTKCQAGDVKNGYYKFSDVWTVVGEYGYDNKGTGYILWVINQDNPDDSFFMGMYFSEKDVPTAEKASAAFWEAYDNYTQSTVYLSGAGRVRDMRSDEKSAFQDAMHTLYGDNSYMSNAVYKTLEYKAFPRQMSVKDWVLVVLGAFLAVCGVIVMITMGGGKSKKQILDKVARSGMNPDQLASEITFGNKFGGTVVTQNVVFREGFTPSLIFLKDVIWCHGKVTTTQNKAYGLVTVSTSKSYAVNFVDRNNKTTSIAVKNPSEQDKIITTVHEAAPYIICGYNEDIANAAQHNFRDLIDAVEHRKYELEHPQPAQPQEQYVFNQTTDGPLPDKIEFTPGSYGLQDSTPAEQQQPLGYEGASATQEPTGYDANTAAQNYDYSGASTQTPLGYDNSAAQQPVGYDTNTALGNYDASSLGDVSDYSNIDNYTNGL